MKLRNLISLLALLTLLTVTITLAASCGPFTHQSRAQQEINLVKKNQPGVYRAICANRNLLNALGIKDSILEQFLPPKVGGLPTQEIMPPLLKGCPK